MLVLVLVLVLLVVVLLLLLLLLLLTRASRLFSKVYTFATTGALGVTAVDTLLGAGGVTVGTQGSPPPSSRARARVCGCVCIP